MSTCPNCGHLNLDTRARKRTRAPERLTPPQIATLQSWCIERHPWALRRLPELIDACLDYWRGLGGDRELHADWVAVCRTWIRKSAAFGPDQAERGYPRRPRPELHEATSPTNEPKATPEQRARAAEMLAKLVESKRAR